jgi:hypothetical protein
MAGMNAFVPTQGLSAGNNRVTDSAIQYDGVVFPVLSRAALAYNSGAYFNPNRKGVRLYINLTVVNGGTLTVKVQTFDQASQTWVDFPLATTTALAAVAVTTLTIYPGVEETANVDIHGSLGTTWRVVATTAVAAVTFGIGAEYLG